MTRRSSGDEVEAARRKRSGGRLPRYTALARGPRPTRKQRSSREFQRVYGSKERVQFIASSPCVVLGCPRQPCQNCHAETGGTGRKANAETVFPACEVHHRELHQLGVQTFQRLHGIDLSLCARRTAEAWVARVERA